MNRKVTHRIQKAGTALAIGLATTLVTIGAQAGTPANPAQFHESVVVRYDDLNLGSTAGAQALYVRISAAANRACGGAPPIRELRQRQAYRICVEDAVDRAVKKVDSERLQALHAERRSARSVG